MYMHIYIYIYRSLGVVSDKLAQLSATPYKREILRRRRRRIIMLIIIIMMIIIGDARARHQKKLQGSSKSWKP